MCTILKIQPLKNLPDISLKIEIHGDTRRFIIEECNTNPALHLNNFGKNKAMLMAVKAISKVVPCPSKYSFEWNWASTKRTKEIVWYKSRDYLSEFME